MKINLGGLGHSAVANAPLPFGSYNMVYLAHSVRPNFCLLEKTSDIPETLYEISIRWENKHG